MAWSRLYVMALLVPWGGCLSEPEPELASIDQAGPPLAINWTVELPESRIHGPLAVSARIELTEGNCTLQAIKTDRFERFGPHALSAWQAMNGSYHNVSIWVRGSSMVGVGPLDSRDAIAYDTPSATGIGLVWTPAESGKRAFVAFQRISGDAGNPDGPAATLRLQCTHNPRFLELQASREVFLFDGTSFRNGVRAMMTPYGSWIAANGGGERRLHTDAASVEFAFYSGPGDRGTLELEGPLLAKSWSLEGSSADVQQELGGSGEYRIAMDRIWVASAPTVEEVFWGMWVAWRPILDLAGIAELPALPSE